MTAAKYLQTGDWVTKPTLATRGAVMIVTTMPEPCGDQMLRLSVWDIATGSPARHTVHQDDDYVTLGVEGLRKRLVVEQEMQLALSRELLASQRIVAAIDTHLAVTP